MFAERLKLAMNYRNKTLTDIADNCKLSKGLLSNYLNGKFNAKQKNIYIIAKYLEISPSYLLGITDKMVLSKFDFDSDASQKQKEDKSCYILDEIYAICSYQDQETLQTILAIVKSLDKRKGDEKNG